MDRLTELEIKVAFQEHLLGELDDVLRTMRDQIERLTTRVADLEATAVPSERVEDGRPPHY